MRRAYRLTLEIAKYNFKCYKEVYQILQFEIRRYFLWQYMYKGTGSLCVANKYD